jgi:hypothetical protein
MESTIVCKPTSLKELESFMGVVNNFKDHLRDHSAVVKPPYDMVASITKQKIKSLAWTPDSHIAFEKLKVLVNNRPKLYFIDYNLPVTLTRRTTRMAHTSAKS